MASVTTFFLDHDDRTGNSRQAVWGSDPSIKGSAKGFPPGLLLDPKFRKGYGRRCHVVEM